MQHGEGVTLGVRTTTLPSSQPFLQARTVGETVRFLRARRGFDQIDLAKACGWRDASAVSRIETDCIRRPTRRTLHKLTEALADTETTGPKGRVRAALYLAAGHLPTEADVTALKKSLPPIEAWPQPAGLLDFGWNVWRANDGLRRLIGLSGDPDGRHLMEIILDPDNSLQDANRESLAKSAAALFRLDTAERAGERWFQALLSRLRAVPDFPALWRRAPKSAPALLERRWRAEIGDEAWGVSRFVVTADPRLWVAQFTPESASSQRHADQLLRAR